MNTLVENQFGHGAIPKPLDLRDHKLGGASAPFDWSAGYDVEMALGTLVGPTTIPTKNQGQSSSCGGQAGSYLEATLKALGIGSFDEKSARNIYSQIFYPDGGTTLRDILNLIVKQGVASEKEVTSYESGNPPSEAFMRDASSNGNTSAKTSEGTGYAFVHPDIDSVAQAIRDNHGAIILIEGQDNGTWLSPFPKPPQTNMWAHFLFCGKAKMIDGKKYIGVHNSWGTSVGENGWQWIGEDYFNSGFITDCGVVYQDTANLTQRIALIQKALELAQKLLNLLFGPTKKPLISG